MEKDKGRIKIKRRMIVFGRKKNDGENIGKMINPKSISSDVVKGTTILTFCEDIEYMS